MWLNLLGPQNVNGVDLGGVLHGNKFKMSKGPRNNMDRPSNMAKTIGPGGPGGNLTKNMIYNETNSDYGNLALSGGGGQFELTGRGENQQANLKQQEDELKKKYNAFYGTMGSGFNSVGNKNQNQGVPIETSLNE